jgi:hypothetical protein
MEYEKGPPRARVKTFIDVEQRVYLNDNVFVKTILFEKKN